VVREHPAVVEASTAASCVDSGTSSAAAKRDAARTAVQRTMNKEREPSMYYI